MFAYDTIYMKIQNKWKDNYYGLTLAHLSFSFNPRGFL